MFVPPPHRSLPSIKTAKERLQALAGKLKGRAITCLDKGKEWAEKGIEKGTAGLGKAAQWCAEIPSPPGLPSAKEMHIAKTAPTRVCRDTEAQVARYCGKVSGPLWDRLELHVAMPAITFEEMHALPTAESSSEVRQRVINAR